MPGTAAPAAAATPAAPAADPNVIDVAATVVNTDEDFANAFDLATGNAPAAAPAADASAAPAVGATDPADGAAAPAPAAGAAPTDGAATAATPAAPAVDGAASPSPAPAATPAPTPPADNGGAHGGPTVESLQAEIAALKAAQAQAQAPAAPAPAPVEQPLYSAAEQTTLDAYKAEWPDVAAGEALVRRQEYQQLTAWIFGQIQPHLDALRSQSNVTHERTQYQVLRELVADYDDIRDPTLKWIDAQPEYLKAAYSKVANEGTPEQVADIISRFRKETGWVKAGAPAAPAAAPTPAAPAPAAAAPTPAAPAAAPAAVAAAAAALKPVGAARTSATPAADPNDFDGAFAEASKL